MDRARIELDTHYNKVPNKAVLASWCPKYCDFGYFILDGLVSQR